MRSGARVSRGPWEKMAEYVRGVADAVGARPKAIPVLSGHWDAKRPTVNAAAAHSLYYDYYGFPEPTYRLAYPAMASPALAAHVRDLLAEAGVASDEEASRGLDHGVF